MRRIRNTDYLANSEQDAEYLSVGKLILYRNALSFNHTVYQVSNICSMWTEDRSREVRNPLPPLIWPLTIAGSILGLAGILSDRYIAVALGVLLVGIAARAWLKFVPSTPVSRFALTVELTSGRKSSFMSSDQSFILRAAQVVAEAISTKSNVPQPVEINFDNKTINIGRVENSNIVGGDVIDSHLEAS